MERQHTSCKSWPASWPSLFILGAALTLAGCATAADSAPSIAGIEDMSCAELSAKVQDVAQYEQRVRAGGRLSQLFTGTGSAAANDVASATSTTRAAIRDAQIAGGC